jgi:hypothetical protein
MLLWTVYAVEMAVPPVRTNVYLWLFNLASSLAPAPLCHFARRRRLEPGTSAGAGFTNCEASAVPEDCLTSLLVSVGTQRFSVGIVTKQRRGIWMFLGSICGRCNKCRFPEASSPVVPHPALFGGYLGSFCRWQSGWGVKLRTHPILFRC